MKKTLHLILLVAVLALTVSCTSSDKPAENRQPQPTDTVYTQQAAMSIYGYQPERALQIIDSAVIVGNLSEVWGDVNRARTLRSCRAHFWVKPNGTSASARAINVDWGDGEQTGITTTNYTNLTNSDGWFTLDGRKLSTEPKQKGVYIVT